MHRQRDSPIELAYHWVSSVQARIPSRERAVRATITPFTYDQTIVVFLVLFFSGFFLLSCPAHPAIDWASKMLEIEKVEFADNDAKDNRVRELLESMERSVPSPSFPRRIAL